MFRSLFFLAAATLASGSATIAEIVGGSSVHTTLYAVVTNSLYSDIAAELSDATKQLTLFGPTNDAFAAAGIGVNMTIDPFVEANVPVVKNVLKYHVLVGKFLAANLVPLNGTFVKLLNNNPIAVGFILKHVVAGATDLVTDNGNSVVHAISIVLMPPQSPGETLPTVSILSTLLQALVRTQLVSTVDGLPDITVFAPSNAAFTAAGVDVSTMNATDLAAVLVYHVIPKRYFSSDLMTEMQLTTVAGKNLTFVPSSSGPPTVNGVALSDTYDVLISNGVVHVIEGVLMPPAETTTTTAATPTTTAATPTGTTTDATPTTTDATPTGTTMAPSNGTTMAPAATTTDDGGDETTSSAAALSSIIAGASVLFAVIC
jgi:uncharacterized surface protein with fasciclin (FAS1) repeats